MPTPGSQQLISRISAAVRPRPASRGTWWLPLVGVVGWLWWTLWPTLRAPFGMADDHAIIDMTAPSGRLPWAHLPATVGNLTSEPVGRFRPLYWTGQALEAALWGRHPTMWYVDRLLLATITLVCLYVVLSKVLHPVLAAMISALPFCGPQVETWTRLGPNEAYAMPLTAAGVMLVLVPALRGRTRPHEAWAGYLLLALAGLAKESFVTVGPGLCLVMVVLGWSRLTRRDWAVAGGVWAAALVDLTAIELKVHRYGSLYPQVHTVGSVAGFLGHVALYETVGAALPILVGLIVVLQKSSGSRDMKPAALVLVGVLMLALPQIYLNAGAARDIEGRYLYPLVLTMVLLWGYAGWLVRRSPQARRLTVLLAVVLALPLTVGAAYGRSVAQKNAATTSQFQATISHVEHAADELHARTIVIQPSDPYWDYEPVESYAAYLKADGYTVVT
ncbi:MAG TPA: hypothetical protein VHW64_06625, partial [Nocardioides sp.]|uniref:hypothetical protein n=1 Tax=Nocardioides sp. TaxID=35761 RepID=UPI002E315625